MMAEYNVTSNILLFRIVNESATKGSCNRGLPRGEVKEKEEGIIQAQSWKTRWH